MLHANADADSICWADIGQLVHAQDVFDHGHWARNEALRVPRGRDNCVMEHKVQGHECSRPRPRRASNRGARQPCCITPACNGHQAL